jgi:outer membrane protein assembly factor BamB
VAPSPAAWEGIVYTTNSGAQVAAVRADGQGDVTKTKVLWTALDCLPDTASPVCDGRYVVQAGSEGTVTCSEAATGKLLWEQSFDSGFLASPVLAGGLVYLWGDKGEVYVIEVGSSYVLKSKVEVGEPLRATPAFVAGAIYIRGEKSLFRVGAR